MSCCCTRLGFHFFVFSFVFRSFFFFVFTLFFFFFLGASGVILLGVSGSFFSLLFLGRGSGFRGGVFLFSFRVLVGRGREGFFFTFYRPYTVS